MIAPILAALALLAIGFVPMQALKSRRAAVIAGIVGLLIVPVAILGFRFVNVGLNSLYLVVYLMWICIVAYGLLTGAITRFVILGRSDITPSQRWGVLAGGYAVFAVVGWFALRQVMGPL